MDINTDIKLYYNYAGYPVANYLPNNTFRKYESILGELVKCQFDKPFFKICKNILKVL